jgi:6-pyruvoyltetrahydropterin/6-carboxytetrahydropterin synthase
MLLAKNDPALETLKGIGERIFVLDKNPTAENIAKLIHDQARSQGLPVKCVEMWESDTAKAKYTA